MLVNIFRFKKLCSFHYSQFDLLYTLMSYLKSINVFYVRTIFDHSNKYFTFRLSYLNFTHKFLIYIFTKGNHLWPLVCLSLNRWLFTFLNLEWNIGNKIRIIKIFYLFLFFLFALANKAIGSYKLKFTILNYTVIQYLQ